MQQRFLCSHRPNKIIYLSQFFIAFCGVFFHSICVSQARDLLLTPKQGLQLHDRSIYYEDNSKAYLSIRPWERTLKHVTFVTLFTENPGSLKGQNSSELAEYEQFLHSPYIAQRAQNAVSLGDIVTLASGWLEQEQLSHTHNKSVIYRFVEGHCNLACLVQKNKILALWQVQKIRHHNNIEQGFQYELKFSISPVVSEATTNHNHESNLLKRNSVYENYATNQQRNFIQKENDYPQHFGRVTDRQAEASNMEPHYTLFNSNFIAKLLGPPTTARVHGLNIGEFMPDSSTPQNIDNGFKRLPNHQFTATTYRPTYSFPQTTSQYHVGQTKRPFIAHHYHHHYYLPHDLDNVEHATLTNMEPQVNYLSHRFDEQAYQLPLPPAPQKWTTASDIEQQAIVRVTPLPQIHKSNYELYPINLGNRGPFFLYPAPVEEIQETTPRVKQFIKSEAWLEEPIRYSEPDPLYLTTFDPTNKSQLEKPATYGNTEYAESVTENTDFYHKSADLDETSSLKDIKVSTEKAGEIIRQENNESHVSSTTVPTITTTTTSTLQKPATAKVEATRGTHFVSTSTAQNALRAVSRYRNANSRYRATTSTTERAVLKWQPKRKIQNSNNNNKTVETTTENEADNNLRYKKMLNEPTNQTTTTTTNSNHLTENTTTTIATILAGSGHEVYEVLTQKSVSKSVSIKVGKNGEELPIILDEDNEISNKPT